MKDIFGENHLREFSYTGSLRNNIFTVGEINRYLKILIESDDLLSDVWVSGEISNYKPHSSGHTYFSLKDNDSQIKCVIFKRIGERIRFELEHGMKVVVRGSVRIYEPYGEYSIVVEDVQPEGLGVLHLAYMQLKSKLEKEGLFSPDRKKELPKFPKVIALITSPTGAVVQDIIKIIGERYPLAKLLIAPTLVQGREAASSIVESLRLVNELPNIDVIILARGGGSLEDLWCFNEEIVARAIFASKIPVISAIGHETDYTIADFVSDYSAPTPSAAAQLVVPDREELKELLDTLKLRSIQAIKYLFETHKNFLKQILNRPVFKRPYEKIHSFYRDLDYLMFRLQTIGAKIIDLNRNNLEILKSRLIALNPQAILKRGYSLVLKDNKIITNFSEVQVEENITVILHKGQLEAQIKKIRRE